MERRSSKRKRPQASEATPVEEAVPRKLRRTEEYPEHIEVPTRPDRVSGNVPASADEGERPPHSHLHFHTDFNPAATLALDSLRASGDNAQTRVVCIEPLFGSVANC